MLSSWLWLVRLRSLPQNRQSAKAWSHRRPCGSSRGRFRSRARTPVTTRPMPHREAGTAAVTTARAGAADAERPPQPTRGVARNDRARCNSKSRSRNRRFLKKLRKAACQQQSVKHRGQTARIAGRLSSNVLRRSRASRFRRRASAVDSRLRHWLTAGRFATTRATWRSTLTAAAKRGRSRGRYVIRSAMTESPTRRSSTISRYRFPRPTTFCRRARI